MISVIPTACSINFNNLNSPKPTTTAIANKAPSYYQACSFSPPFHPPNLSHHTPVFSISTFLNPMSGSMDSDTLDVNWAPVNYRNLIHPVTSLGTCFTACSGKHCDLCSEKPKDPSIIWTLFELCGWCKMFNKRTQCGGIPGKCKYCKKEMEGMYATVRVKYSVEAGIGERTRMEG